MIDKAELLELLESLQRTAEKWAERARTDGECAFFDGESYQTDKIIKLVNEMGINKNAQE